MSANCLKLNAEKTELLWAGSRYVAAAILGSSGLSLRLGEETVAPSDHGRVLGVTFSSDLSLDKHVSSVTVTCFYFLHQLWRVRLSLDINSTPSSCRAWITAMPCLTDQGLSRLLHDELHWLNVPGHQCLQNKAPRYLVDCCIPVSDVASRQHLRSASRHLLTVLRFQRNTFGRRTFSVRCPMAWNSLPDSLQDPSHCSSSFRRNLKTVLFASY